MFHMYNNPGAVGWLGYFEDAQGNITAFVGLDRRIVFFWPRGCPRCKELSARTDLSG